MWLKDVHGLGVQVLQPNQPIRGMVRYWFCAPGQEDNSQSHCPDTNTNSSGPLVPAGQDEQLQNMTST